MRRFRFSALLALAAFAACEEAALLTPDLPEDCASPRACQVAGVDLVVEPPQFLVTAEHARDPLTGHVVLSAGESVPIAVTVWNRGDLPSDSARLSLYPNTNVGASAVLPVPPLRPGALNTDTLVWQVAAGIIAWTDTTWLHVEVQGGLQQSEDPLNGNDSNDSDAVVVALPVLRATLVAPDTVHAEVTFPVTVTIRNLSRFADLTPRAMAFCLFDYDVGCGSGGGGDPFHLTSVPAIPAGGSWTVELEVTIPDQGPYYSPWNWHLYACFADAGASLDMFLDWNIRHCVDDAPSITVLDPPSAGRPGGAR